MRDEEINRHHKKWSHEETEALIRLCKKGYALEAICQEMGRNENSIKKKAYRLGYSFQVGRFDKRPVTMTKNNVVGSYTVRKPWWKRIFG